MAKYIRILSIDGGGIRGIIPGRVLVTLEEILQKKARNPNAKIADFFDLIAGTSTGGILTCIYLCPGKGEKKNKYTTQPRFTAEEAVELYLDRGDEIFDVSLWHKIKSAGGLADEQYSTDELEEALDDYFGDLKLSELLKPCLITAYDIKNRKTVFFTQHTAKKESKEDFYVREVARATSAAPTYFEVARVKSFKNTVYPLIDGGVFANNPALCAYAEVRAKFKNKPTAKDMVILSIGTGFEEKPYYYKQAKDWGKVRWVVPLIDIMMSGVSETVDYQLLQIFSSVNCLNHYLRINDRLEYAEPAMDNASQENLQNLKKDGDRIAKNYKGKLEKLADLLIK